MFQAKSNHVCAIGLRSSKSFLPHVSPDANSFRKLLRALKKHILVAERNPRSFEFFRSAAEIMSERKNQVQSGSWVIHPFSTFRVYYEMWMAIVFFICLIYLPLDTAYDTVMEKYAIVHSILSFVCLIDIVITFRTGYPSPHKEQIIMKPGAIAKHYIFGIFFVCDLLSSIPKIFVTDKNGIRIIEYLQLLKILRSITFIVYMTRTFFFFKMHGMLNQILKLLVIILLINHYFACLVYMVPIHRPKGVAQASSGDFTVPINETFSTAYVIHLYKGCAYLLGIDIRLASDTQWWAYFLMAIGYCIGKILTVFATVVIIDMLKSKHSLENKYFTMMSQVDAYMGANKVPSVIQKRMREYYQYKYRQKYFKESSITKFLSENLKKEINYHVCRKLVESVNIFAKLSQKILEDILTHLKVEIYLTGDIIIQAGTLGDCMYFLASGTVMVSSPSGKEICHLEDGAYFGEIALVITGQKRTANVVAIEIAEVYKLDRKAFKKCMESNKDLYKRIQREAKKRLAATQQVESMFMKEFAQRL